MLGVVRSGMGADFGVTQPGNPNDETLDGYGSMMEVAYVAVYESDVRWKPPTPNQAPPSRDHGVRPDNDDMHREGQRVLDL